jgi:hypothetical protein
VTGMVVPSNFWELLLCAGIPRPLVYAAIISRPSVLGGGGGGSHHLGSLGNAESQHAWEQNGLPTPVTAAVRGEGQEKWGFLGQVHGSEGPSRSEGPKRDINV